MIFVLYVVPQCQLRQLLLELSRQLCSSCAVLLLEVKAADNQEAVLIWSAVNMGCMSIAGLQDCASVVPNHPISRFPCAEEHSRCEHVYRYEVLTNDDCTRGHDQKRENNNRKRAPTYFI